MKLFSFSCAAVLVGSALLLSACGGGGSTTQSAAPAPSFSVGGTVTGLGNAGGLTLVNGTEILAVAANATAFAFANKLPENSTYNVSVGGQPTGLTCKLSNASGSVAQADVRAVAVNCDPKIPFTVSTLAGGASATINNPYGVATDAAGNIYAAEAFTCAILKITPLGVVTSLAGGGSCASVDGTGAAARFNYPTNLTVDKAGNLFVTESQNIRKVTPAGVVTTPYGSGTPGLVDAAGAPVQAFNPWGIAVDDAGTLYVSAQNSILKITPGGVVTTLAGNGSAGYVDGAGSAARFSSPKSVALDAAGNVYVADDYNGTIRKITPQGQVTSLLNGKLSGPIGVAVDLAGNVYATGDRTFISKVTGPVFFGGVVYIITSAGVVTKVGGRGNGPVDGPPSTASFNTTQGITVDGLGNIYVAENGAIRKITP
ncbi:MAG: hypothetical protein V4858_02425 [Pseudomonadota bacterium]